METRAPYVLVGAVAVLATAALAAFALWLGDAALGEERERFDIYFEEPVSGLDVGSPVRFNGIRVGRVVETRLDPERPTGVRVTVAVGEDTPIQEGAEAVVLPQGLTGSSYIQIESGPAPAPPLLAQEGRPRPVIPSRKSPIARLVGGAPDLVMRTTVLVERLSRMVDRENRRALTRSLERMETVTANLAAESEELTGVADAIESAAAETQGAARSVDRATGRFATWMDRDLAPLTAEAHSMLQGAHAFVRRLDTNLNGRLAPRLVALTEDLERVAERTAAIAEELEESPREFLLREDGVREVRIR